VGGWAFEEDFHLEQRPWYWDREKLFEGKPAGRPTKGEGGFGQKRFNNVTQEKAGNRRVKIEWCKHNQLVSRGQNNKYRERNQAGSRTLHGAVAFGAKSEREKWPKKVYYKRAKS